MPFSLDPKLEEYATPIQWVKVKAWAEHGSQRAAALSLGTPQSDISDSWKAILKKAAKAGYAPEFDLRHPVPNGLTLKGTSIRYGADGNVDQYWNKTKQAGREPDEVERLPDPRTISKISTLYDQEGKVTQQWISEKPADIQRETLWREFAKELAADMPRVEPMPYIAPETPHEDLMACYPVGDHHLGMLAWDKETGADYDLEIGEQILNRAFDHLLATTPVCGVALLAFLGDYIHYDGFESVTPAHRNQLDSDSRFPKMIRVAVRTTRYAIEAALRRHKTVRVIVEFGNHDPATTVFIMECLHNIYENEPRVTIDTSPQHFHYFKFGRTLIGTHHGHGTKMQNLPMIMANDRAEDWGATDYRYWWTGHVHHDQVIEVPGCRMESFRILPPRDAYAQQKGYRAGRDMKAILIHKDHGEVARNIVTPGMIGF